jgi:hypothetical protein
MGYVQSEGRTQATLFPVTLEELIPDDHVCRVIDAFVARLDMAGLRFARTLHSFRLASCKTVLPTLPLAPVIRIIFCFLFMKPAAAGQIQPESCEPNTSRAWYNGAA